MAALHRNHRTTYVPPSPGGLAEDLAEIINEEQCNGSSSLRLSEETPSSSRPRTANPAATTNDLEENSMKSSAKRKMYRSLIESWNESITLMDEQVQHNRKRTAETSDERTQQPMPYETETPSKLLSARDAEEFSKHALCEADLLPDDHRGIDVEARKENEPLDAIAGGGVCSLDPKWEKLVCGQTTDQQYMVRQAHACLKKFTLTPRTLNFERPFNVSYEADEEQKESIWRVV